MWGSILFQPNRSQEDGYVWTKSASGNCIIKSVWEGFRTVGTRVDSARLLWHPWHIPRHSFVLWLVCKGQIPKWSHLQWPQPWEEATRTFDNMKNPWHRVAGIVIASAVYHIWKERNNRMHNQIFKSALSTRDDIINNVRERLANLESENQLPNELMQRWSLT
ncbi:hypothetical protein OIU78_007414 [Salix suchowensis]|nr:hypothetical protein OIU78_007414 [Salix suchowensis]